VCGAPLLVKTSNGTLCPGAPLIVLEKKLLVMAHRVSGAPLVMGTLMAHLYLVRHCYIAVAHHLSSAPLIVILRIALFRGVPCDIFIKIMLCGVFVCIYSQRKSQHKCPHFEENRDCNVINTMK
jgi:hypothetical protein